MPSLFGTVAGAIQVNLGISFGIVMDWGFAAGFHAGDGTAGHSTTPATWTMQPRVPRHNPVPDLLPTD